jgi:hypothetical protein
MRKQRARYRASQPETIIPAQKPRRRWLKRLFGLAFLVGYAALMWYVVFPYIDQHFINQPAL